MSEPIEFNNSVDLKKSKEYEKVVNEPKKDNFIFVINKAESKEIASEKKIGNLKVKHKTVVDYLRIEFSLINCQPIAEYLVSTNDLKLFFNSWAQLLKDAYFSVYDTRVPTVQPTNGFQFGFMTHNFINAYMNDKGYEVKNYTFDNGKLYRIVFVSTVEQLKEQLDNKELDFISDEYFQLNIIEMFDNYLGLIPYYETVDIPPNKKINFLIGDEQIVGKFWSLITWGLGAKESPMYPFLTKGIYDPRLMINIFEFAYNEEDDIKGIDIIDWRL